MGTFEDVDVARDGRGWGSYLRLRVILDITKPLNRGRALSLERKSTLVEFKYEKLPLFCLWCGCIGHGSKGCPVPASKRYSTVEETKPWGSWLRAADPKQRSFRGEGEFKQETSTTQYRAVSKEVGEQSEGGTVVRQSLDSKETLAKKPKQEGDLLVKNQGPIKSVKLMGAN